MKRPQRECPECKQIARDMAETLVRVLRADPKENRQTRRRCADVLEAKDRHESVTGHHVPA
jgi:hypothetical protein